MAIKKLLFTILLLLPFLSSYAQSGSYVLKLTDVSLNGRQVGTIRLDSIMPSKLMMYVNNFRDSLIDATLKWDDYAISFDISNKSNRSMKIVWNDAAYIDYSNTTSKVMHQGTKYIDRNGDQPATTLLSESKISDMAIPVNNVYFNSRYRGGWEKTSLFPSVGKKDQRNLVGKKVKLLIPIQQQSSQLEYVFTFNIVFNEYKKS